MIKRISVVSILCFLLFLAGCSDPGKNIGFTDTQVTIGCWGPLTGPAAYYGQIIRGMDAYFKDVNEKGGVHGRKINFIYRDDAYNPVKTMAVAKELIEQHQVFAVVGGAGTAQGLTVKKTLQENNVPWVAPITGSFGLGFPNEDHVFSNFVNYADEGSVLAEYIVEKLHKNKIVVLYQNDDFGKTGLSGIETYLEKQNIALLDKIPIEVRDTDLSSQSLQAKKSGAEAVILFILPKHAAIFLKTAAIHDFKPEWVAASICMDNALMYRITDGLWKGVSYSSFLPRPDSSQALFSEYRKNYKKYAPKDNWGEYFYMGYYFGEPFVEALKQCGKNLSREKLIRVLKQMKYQGIGQKVDFTNGNLGVHSMRILKSVSMTKSEEVQGYTRSKIDLKTAYQKLQEMK